MSSRRVRRSGAAVALLTALLVLAWIAGALDLRTGVDPHATGTDFSELWRDHRSDIDVEGHGVVERLLADDQQGSPHQRFLVRLAHGQTLLVAHNLDLASRIPLRVGEAVEFRGVYEWNDRGGVVHWTHDDPHGRRRGGFVQHAGRRYE